MESPATLEWLGDLPGKVRLIDQTKLPNEFVHLDLETVEPLFDAIRRLSVRGAPAIGVSAAYGVILGIQNEDLSTLDKFHAALEKTCSYLAESRPTAVNLFWALDRMKKFGHGLAPDLDSDGRKRAMLEEARRVHEEDREICRRIGRNAQPFIKSGDTSLTHCNAGGLATSDYGTALACFFAAQEEGKAIHVFADETRPLLQGSRLTAWELKARNIGVTVICDNMAGQVMKEGRIQSVFVGSDRIAGNGDAANKIGTYMVSVLAKEHGIPFYVAAPTSTFDLTLTDGSQIPIELRDPKEVTAPLGQNAAPEGIEVYNPAFDVTPAAHIAAIITEFGAIEKPNLEKVRAHFDEFVPDR